MGEGDATSPLVGWLRVSGIYAYLEGQSYSNPQIKKIITNFGFVARFHS